MRAGTFSAPSQARLPTPPRTTLRAPPTPTRLRSPTTASSATAAGRRVITSHPARLPSLRPPSAVLKREAHQAGVSGDGAAATRRAAGGRDADGGPPDPLSSRRTRSSAPASRASRSLTSTCASSARRRATPRSTTSTCASTSPSRARGWAPAAPRGAASPASAADRKSNV